MFQRLADFAIRFRWALVVFWVVAAVVLSRSLPSLASVVQGSTMQFLPATSPSQQAAQLAAPFQGTNPPGTAVLIGYRVGGPLTDDDRATITRIEQDVSQMSGVDSVRDGG